MIVNSTATVVPLKTQTAPTGEMATFQFVAGWILLIVILIGANKTRVGHVILYYSLLLIILFILVTEYAQITPLLYSIQTVGDFSSAMSPPTVSGGTF